MFDTKTIQKVKDTLVLIVLTAVVSLVPFYFHTSAMTKENKAVNEAQTLEISQTAQSVHALELDRAIDATEIRQIKESLERIERKLDKVIQSNELENN